MTKRWLLLGVVSMTLSCVDGASTGGGSRLTRSRLSDSAHPAGADDVHGGSDMPGKGRGGEHDRHSMVHK